MQYPEVCSDLNAPIDLLFGELLRLEQQGPVGDLDKLVSRFGV